MTQTILVDRIRFHPDQWLWCLHCQRFFQARDARPDVVGGVEGCAFEDCDGAGFDVDLYEWDAWVGDDPSRRALWPRLEDLHKGRAASLDALDADDDAIDATDVVAGTLDLGGADAVWNRDCQRRDLLLGSETLDDPDTSTPFADLDLGRLALLIQEGFLDPDARQNRAPSARDCLVFMRLWPQVRTHGFAIHPERDDYRVSVEGLACALDAVPPADRAALRRDFVRFCAGADVLLDDGSTLHAWWD